MISINTRRANPALGCNAWTISKYMWPQKNFEALCVSYEEYCDRESHRWQRNQMKLVTHQQAHSQIEYVNTRQPFWAMRCEERNWKTAATGRIEGKQRKKMLDGLTRWLDMYGKTSDRYTKSDRRGIEMFGRT